MAEKERSRSSSRRTIAETDIGKLIISCISNEWDRIYMYNLVSSILGIYLIGENMGRILLSIFKTGNKKEWRAQMSTF